MSNGLRKKKEAQPKGETMASLIINPAMGSLLSHACIEAPLRGLRLADIERIEQLKKLVRVQKTTAVEIPADLVQLLMQLWEALDIGTLRRVDELPELLRATQTAIDLLKEK